MALQFPNMLKKTKHSKAQQLEMNHWNLSWALSTLKGPS
jgi:hypothetical protein